MISQHSHIKVQNLHQLSLYNSSYFDSYLWMHRLTQMRELWKAWLVSRAHSTTWEGLSLACSRIPSLLCPPAMEGLGQTTLTLERKKHLNEWVLPKEFFPTKQKPLPQGTSWIPPANGPQKITAVSKAMNFLVTGVFLFNCLNLTYSTGYHLGCQEFVFLGSCLQNSLLPVCIQCIAIYRELQKRKLS